MELRPLRPILVSTVVLLFSALPNARVDAASVDTNGPYSVLTGRLQGRGDAEALFLWSHNDRKLAVYLITGQTMKLLFVRNCRYDFELDGSIGDQTPTVKEVRSLVADGKQRPLPPDAGADAHRYTVALGRIQGLGEADVLYIWSHAQRRLAVYAIQGDLLELLFSRDCAHDLSVQNSLGRTTPSVKDLKALVEKQNPKLKNPESTGPRPAPKQKQ